MIFQILKPSTLRIEKVVIVFLTHTHSSDQNENMVIAGYM